MLQVLPLPANPLSKSTLSSQIWGTSFLLVEFVVSTTLFKKPSFSAHSHQSVVPVEAKQRDLTRSKDEGTFKIKQILLEVGTDKLLRPPFPLFFLNSQSVELIGSSCVVLRRGAKQVEPLSFPAAHSLSHTLWACLFQTGHCTPLVALSAESLHMEATILQGLVRKSEDWRIISRGSHSVSWLERSEALQWDTAPVLSELSHLYRGVCPLVIPF